MIEVSVRGVLVSFLKGFTEMVTLVHFWLFQSCLRGSVGILNSVKGLQHGNEATGKQLCQEIQSPSFQISLNKSACHQPPIHLLLIDKFSCSSRWLTVDFDHYLTCHCRCSASFCHEPSSWNATVARISMATCLPLTSPPPLHNQWERSESWHWNPVV